MQNLALIYILLTFFISVFLFECDLVYELHHFGPAGWQLGGQ